MKKFVTIIILFIVIICIIIYAYYNYKTEYNNINMQIVKFENYYEKEIYGTDLATVINMAIDNNRKNEVMQDEQGIYINNQENSINIQIKITDNDTLYNMETLYNAGMENFVKYYNTIKFKCTKIEYHQKTKKVSYLYFEQISE